MNIKGYARLPGSMFAIEKATKKPKLGVCIIIYVFFVRTVIYEYFYMYKP